MPVLRPSGSDFTSFVKAAAQYVPAGGGGKVSKSGGVSVALPGLGAVVRASQIGALASPTTSAVVINGITPPASGGAPRTPVATIFTYTGADQVYVVPAGVTSVTLFMWAAGGAGGSAGFKGGAGAALTGTLTVSPGETLTVMVGQSGGRNDWPGLPSPATYGGGGDALSTVNGGPYGGTGGGRSAIRRAGADVVTVGGGGAGGYSSYGGAGSATGTGRDGSVTANGSGNTYGGKGGTTSAGGAGGAGGVEAGGNGSLYTGGSAADYGGAGGGGYYGGGGGASTASGNTIGGGGGGSALITNLTTVTSYNSTDGFSAPFTGSIYYNGTSAAGGPSAGFGTIGARGGNGLVVIFA